MAAKKTSTKSKSSSTRKTAKKGRKGGMSSTMMAGAAGAVVGAAIGGAAAAAIAHERTRRALSDTANELGEYASDAVKNNKKAIHEVTDALSDTPQKRSHASAR